MQREKEHVERRKVSTSVHIPSVKHPKVSDAGKHNLHG